MTISSSGIAKKRPAIRGPHNPDGTRPSRDSLGSLLDQVRWAPHEISLVWTVTWSIDGRDSLQEAWKASSVPSAMVELLLFVDETGEQAWRAAESVCRVLRAPGSSSWRKLRTSGFGGNRASAQQTVENMVRAATRTQVQSAYRLNGIRFLCDTIRAEVPFPYELPDLMRELARFT